MNLPGRHHGAGAQPARGGPLLRTVDSPGEAAAPQAGALAHRASRDGQDVVRLRRVDLGGRVVVECDVYPVSGLRAEPLQPGPYGFPSPAEADRFIRDTLLSLEYLGCEIA